MTSVNSDLYLSPDQQDLLLAALNSNATSSSMFLPNSHSAHHPQVDDRQFIPTSDFGSLGHFTNQKSNPNGAHPVPTSVASNSDMDMTRTNSLTAFGGISTLHDSPVVGEMDFPFDMDGSYDYDTFPGDFETTIDSTNGTPAMYEHEKRKSPPTDDDGSPDAPETGPKRRGTFQPRFFSQFYLVEKYSSR